MNTKNSWRRAMVLLAAILGCRMGAGLPGGEKPSLAAEPGTYAAWKNGPSKDPGYFPIAVWLQDPKNAAKYKALGINVYVAVWRGPNAEQIAELKKHGMSLVCGQNRYALEHLDEPIIIGWMHGDEPDNAQSLPGGKGYGPPIPPAKIVEDYRKITSKDPTRPVMLNLGQGVAWDGWYGRGVRTRHPEDYPEYARGGDIISFDIYPVVHDRREIAGNLWYVPYGVQRLRQWTNGQKVIWDCIECTRISNPNTKPTPAQVKAEVWMSIIHGSQGLIYFCHQFKPNFIEAGLLADAEMAKAVGAVNRQIHELAPAINSPSVPDSVTVKTVPWIRLTIGAGVNSFWNRGLLRSWIPLRPTSRRIVCECSAAPRSPRWSSARAAPLTSSRSAWTPARPRPCSSFAASPGRPKSKSSARTAGSRLRTGGSPTTSPPTRSTFIGGRQ